ncbi:MAG: type II secretion system protein [Candidatus Omnitrophica bacterium]|nr:type II secretion system protein [Candidatus Omnitrophota bacterium]
MKKGFTLLELMVVIIIIGVLATLGVMQYQAAIEKSRGAEARQILGQLRSQCAAIYMGEGSGTNCNAGNLRIGTATDTIPSACRATNYFSYAVTPAATGLASTATRCIASGKTPNGSTAHTLILTTNFGTGSDTWVSTGGY